MCAVSLVPTPATTAARSPTASTTARSRRSFSSSLVVGDSPVVPLITSPSLRWSSTRWTAKRCAPSTSSSPAGVNGVTIAVSRRPNGARTSGCVMVQTYPAVRAQPSVTRGLDATSVPSSRVAIAKSANAFGATRCSSRRQATASSRISTSACSVARIATKCRQAR